MKDYADHCGSCRYCDLTDNVLTSDTVYFHCARYDVFAKADGIPCEDYEAAANRTPSLIEKYDVYRGYAPPERVIIHWTEE